MPSGKFKYAAPPGKDDQGNDVFHDDCVISLALAVWGAREFLYNKDYEESKLEFHKRFKFCVDHTSEVEQMTKIFLSNNFMRVKVREFWEERCNTFEADIKANKRYL